MWRKWASFIRWSGSVLEWDALTFSGSSESLLLCFERSQLRWSIICPWCLLDASQARSFEHKQQGEDHRANQRLDGEIISLFWLGNTWVSMWRSWRKWLEIERSPGHGKMDGWMDGIYYTLYTLNIFCSSILLSSLAHLRLKNSGLKNSQPSIKSSSSASIQL